uniref:Insulin-like growth factor binding protein 6b n=1 Tax=Sinocyclocheilus rhinocerous TaxID=307959 RepID=A0A673M836_9TELE
KIIPLSLSLFLSTPLHILSPSLSLSLSLNVHPLGAGRTSRDPAGAPSTIVLALGEPCGVYTLSCAKGLRCVPPPREHRPLQALLQGRGFCAKQSRTSPTERSLQLKRAPCRKLLNTVLRGLELTIFQSDRDIYIPNCNTRGFYRKKQCRSSKGMQRGHCWCVDYIYIYNLLIYLMNYDAMYFYIVSSFSLSKQSLFYLLRE